MLRTIQKVIVKQTGGPRRGDGDRRHTGRAFAGGTPPTVEVQAVVRFRDQDQRGGIVASGVPRPRIEQTLAAVLSLPDFREVPAKHLRVDVHRGDEGRYRHHYGLALAVAMMSSLGRRAVEGDYLFVGDVDLLGNVREVTPELIDELNDSIDRCEIETPVTVVMAPAGAAWVANSSLVRVAPVRTLAEVAKAVWPGVALSTY